MKDLKWRVLLSLSNLLLSLGLSAIGMQEYYAFRESHPGAFYHGHHAYLPVAQLVSYCMNAPSFLLSNMLGNLPVWGPLWDGTRWFYYVDREFYVLLFMFWWLVGWRLDVRSQPPARGPSIAVAGYLTGALLSFGLLGSGTYVLCTTSFPSEWVPGGRAIPTSILLWGVVLLCYFVKMLMPRKS